MSASGTYRTISASPDSWSASGHFQSFRMDIHIPTKLTGAVWTSAFGKPLTRIDPVTNSVTHQFVSLGGDSVRYGYGVLWLTDQKSNLLWKIEPSINYEKTS